MGRTQFIHRLISIVAITFLVGVAPMPVLAADTDVFAEGAYTDTALDVYIYANISTNLVSFGVALNYDSAKLTVVSATKNEAAWYFGNGTTNNPYMNPDTATPGQIIFIGGKLDTANPTAGVVGQRVLLGKATFNRSDADDPNPNPEDYFGISLALGKATPYDNFVTTTGTVQDIDTGGVAFVGDKVRERGDANADLYITGADRSAINYFLANGGVAYLWMDCNDDKNITGADRSCINFKLANP